MIRLFVAIELPEEVKARLGALSVGVSGARWVRLENLHLTLRFIGDVDEGRLQDIDEALGLVRAPGFEAALEGVGCFPPRGAPKVIWVGVEKNGALVRLRDKVESALVRTGLAPEGRKYAPHVTLARPHHARMGRIQEFMSGNLSFTAGPFPVRNFTLFSSFLSRNGAIHRVEAEYPLTGA